MCVCVCVCVYHYKQYIFISKFTIASGHCNLVSHTDSFKANQTDTCTVWGGGCTVPLSADVVVVLSSTRHTWYTVTHPAVLSCITCCPLHRHSSEHWKLCEQLLSVWVLEYDICYKFRWNEMNGVLDDNSTLKGYTGQGTTWANEMQWTVVCMGIRKWYML